MFHYCQNMSDLAGFYILNLHKFHPNPRTIGIIPNMKSPNLQSRPDVKWYRQFPIGNIDLLVLDEIKLAMLPFRCELEITTNKICPKYFVKSLRWKESNVLHIAERGDGVCI